MFSPEQVAAHISMPHREWINYKALFENPENEIPRLCDIDMSDLMLTMQRHSGLFAAASASLAVAKAAEEEDKVRYEYARSDAFSNLTEVDPSLAIGRAEKMADSTLAVIQSRLSYQKASRKAAILKALVSALEHRRDMLVQIAARDRQEMRLYT